MVGPAFWLVRCENVFLSLLLQVLTLMQLLKWMEIVPLVYLCQRCDRLPLGPWRSWNFGCRLLVCQNTHVFSSPPPLTACAAAAGRGALPRQPRTLLLQQLVFFQQEAKQFHHVVKSPCYLWKGLNCTMPVVLSSVGSFNVKNIYIHIFYCYFIFIIVFIRNRQLHNYTVVVPALYVCMYVRSAWLSSSRWVGRQGRRCTRYRIRRSLTYMRFFWTLTNTLHV